MSSAQRIVVPGLTQTRDDKFQRLAIIVKTDTNESIDVVDEHGKTLMRLNLFNHGENKRSVDVIFAPKNITGYLVQSWKHGMHTLHEFIEGELVSISNIVNKNV